jgi:predicted nucleotidyltransferase
MNNDSTILDEIERNRAAVESLCRKFHVRRLEIFGSAVDGSFDPTRSDLDFLVEFDRPQGVNAFRQYFDFQFALADMFDRKVDLVQGSAMRNPYFIQSVNRSRKLFYAA